MVYLRIAGLGVIVRNASGFQVGFRAGAQTRSASRLVGSRCGSPVVLEVVEDADVVAIQIGGQKLTQPPRFILGFGNDLGLRGLPLCEELVHFSLAVKIEPEKDSARITVVLPEERVVINSLQFPLEMPAIPSCSSPQSKVKPSVST